jgi:hypothetical protein
MWLQVMRIRNLAWHHIVRNARLGVQVHPAEGADVLRPQGLTRPIHEAPLRA